MCEIKLPDNSRFTIISLDVPSVKNRKQAIVKCNCGTITQKQLGRIVNGYTLSCGCLAKEKSSERLKQNRKHEGRGKRLYNIWKNMRQRCSNPNASGYKNYGAKDIRVDEVWNEYTSFEDWAFKNGYNDNLEIDRIDSTKDYTPNNCQWVTKSINSSKRNKDSKNKGFTRSRFTEEIIEEIQTKRKQGYIYQKLANEYGTSISHIKRIVDGEIKYTKLQEEIK
ncbi:MAG: hypothetical protein ACRCX2_31860 [Paraclostridium sp.]